MMVTDFPVAAPDEPESNEKLLFLCMVSGKMNPGLIAMVRIYVAHDDSKTKFTVTARHPLICL